MSDAERSLLLALKWWVAEKDLADDLAEVIKRFFPFGDTGTYEVEQAMARWREARA